MSEADAGVRPERILELSERLNAVAGDLPLASGGSVGTQVNTLV